MNKLKEGRTDKTGNDEEGHLRSTSPSPKPNGKRCKIVVSQQQGKDFSLESHSMKLSMIRTGG